MEPGSIVYVKPERDDGSRTPARLVAIKKEFVMVRYAHIGGVFTFSRKNVLDANDNILPFQEDKQ